jgi:glycosyltransferase involved in cell wall biosynthesis
MSLTLQVKLNMTPILILVLVCTLVVGFHDEPTVLVVSSMLIQLPTPNNRTFVPPLRARRYVSFRIILRGNDSNVNQDLFLFDPDAILTIGGRSVDYRELCALSFEFRTRWIHEPVVEDSDSFFQRVSVRLEKVMEESWLRSHPRLSSVPLVSVFTPTCHGGDKLWRVFLSLRNQSWDNWEWIVVVDDPGDDVSIGVLREMSLLDVRVQYWLPHRQSGIIGQRKREAAMLASGDILAEVDHDDELLTDCLEMVVRAFQLHPDIGFVYSDFAEPIYGTSLTRFASYGDDFPLHFWHNTTHASSRPGRVLLWATGTRDLKEASLYSLVALPNHIRAWRASLYRAMNGHRRLIVSDDHEIMLRTFSATRFMHIDKVLYLQYRNPEKHGHDNFTFKRNALIQHLSKLVHQHFVSRGDLRARAANLGGGHLQFDFGFTDIPMHITACVLPGESNASLSTVKSLEAHSGDETKIIVLANASLSEDFFGQRVTVIRAPTDGDTFERCFTVARTQYVSIFAPGALQLASFNSYLETLSKSCAGNCTANQGRIISEANACKKPFLDSVIMPRALIWAESFRKNRTIPREYEVLHMHDCGRQDFNSTESIDAFGNASVKLVESSSSPVAVMVFETPDICSSINVALLLSNCAMLVLLLLSQKYDKASRLKPE